MSKGSSHLFSGTSGEGKALIEEVVANGVKISPKAFESFYTPALHASIVYRPNRYTNRCSETEYVFLFIFRLDSFCIIIPM